MLSYYISQLQSILYVAPVMLLAIIVHECAHGWVSDKGGSGSSNDRLRQTESVPCGTVSKE